MTIENNSSKPYESTKKSDFTDTEDRQRLIDVLEMMAASKATRYVMVLDHRPRPLMEVYHSQKNRGQARARLDILEKYDLLTYSTLGKKTMVSLTVRGMDVAAHLTEIGRILGESKRD